MVKSCDDFLNNRICVHTLHTHSRRTSIDVWLGSTCDCSGGSFILGTDGRAGTRHHFVVQADRQQRMGGQRSRARLRYLDPIGGAISTVLGQQCATTALYWQTVGAGSYYHYGRSRLYVLKKTVFFFSLLSFVVVCCPHTRHSFVSLLLSMIIGNDDDGIGYPRALKDFVWPNSGGFAGSWYLVIDNQSNGGRVRFSYCRQSRTIASFFFFFFLLIF
jgi:hypothetical protein